MELIEKYFQTLTSEQRDRFAALDALYHDWNAKINVISRKDIDNLYEHHVLHSLGIAKIINFRPGTRVLDLGTGGGFPGIPLAILFPEVEFHLVDSIGKKIRVCNEVITALGLTNVTTQHARAEEIKYAPNPKKLKKSQPSSPSSSLSPSSSSSPSSSPSSVGCPAYSRELPSSSPLSPSSSSVGCPAYSRELPSPSTPLPSRFDFVVSRAVMPLADLVKISRPHISQHQQNPLPNGLIALKGGELEHEASAVRATKLITSLSDFFSEEYFKTKKVVYVHL